MRGDFSSVYARVKSGDKMRPPYVPPPPQVEKPSPKVSVPAQVEDFSPGLQRDASSSLDQEEPVAASSEDYFAPPTVEEPPEEDLHKSFSLTTLELPETELCLRLSNESRDMFEKEEKPSTSIAGWQRYSVSFGAGRMGIEFEWDAKSTRRLVVTRVGKEAASLGVRARDVLIGVGNRPIPRATDPIAVHKHLISCARPVTLHFYRLHVRRVEPNNDNEEQETTTQELEESRSRLGMIASAVWDRLPALSGSQDLDDDPPAPPELTTRASSDAWPPPAIIVDPERYRSEDDDDQKVETDDKVEEADDEAVRWTCLLNATARKSLANALKPVLRPKPWMLMYDSICDGMCLGALYNRANLAPKGPQLLLIRDDKRNVAGAFVDEKIRNVGDYFGTGECFVFQVDSNDVRVYRWVGPQGLFHDREEDEEPTSRPSSVDMSDSDFANAPPLPSIENDMFIYASNDLLGFGSGGGGFAIRIDEALEFGASRPCATYGNDASLFNGRDTFPIQRVQLWAFAPVPFY